MTEDKKNSVPKYNWSSKAKQKKCQKPSEQCVNNLVDFSTYSSVPMPPILTDKNNVQKSFLFSLLSQQMWADIVSNLIYCCSPF